IMQQGRSVPMMLTALSTYHADIPQLVIVEGDDAESGRALLSVIRDRYVPTAVTVPVRASHRDALARLLPWTAAMGTRNGKATAYVCRNFACQQPVTSAEELRSQL